MPHVLSAAIALVAGALLGLQGAPLLSTTLAVTAVACWAVLTDRGAVLVALGAILLAAQDQGARLRAADARCLAEAVRATAWEVELQQAVAPGGFARAVQREVAKGRVRRGPGCVVELALAVRAGTAAAGRVVRVRRAEPTGSDRGLLLREAQLTVVRGPGPLDRWRNQVAATLDRRFGPDGPAARALLIADTRGLSPELRDRYADAGLVHILSISGLHVAIVGGALLLLFQAVRLPLTAARLAAVGTAVLYVLAIGAPPPAARSVTLFAATTLAQLRQRPVSPWGTFALAAVVPLAELRTVLDLGWQLSVSGYAAIIVAGRLGRRIPRGWAGWRRTVAKELVTGVLASLATAALVTWHFGRLSLIAPLSNLVVGPVIALLQPTLFLVMVLPDALGAPFVVDAARPLLRAMDGIARGAAGVPGAVIDVAPSATTAWLVAVLTGAVLVAGWARRPMRWILLALSAGALMVWLPDGPVLDRGARRTEIHLLDVGQGDAIAIRSPRGRWALIDAGRAWSGGDAGRSTIVPHLRRRGGPLALLVLTHPHADHLGGAASVARALRPAVVYDAGFVLGQPGYRELLATFAARRIPWRRVRPGTTHELDGIALDFLAPDSAWAAARDDPNEASTVVRLRVGAHRFLFMGDAEAGEEGWLLDHLGPEPLHATVLKVGHHGSRTSTSAPFLAAVRPRLALVSVGANNGYGHPHPEVMRRLAAQGATVLRTDQLGTVILRTDGALLEAEVAGRRWLVASPLPPSP
ncbi:MAG: DNA internalization-related competence protein ComEC/Rec2 [Gemmatimonadaceae bacterium]